MLNLEVRETLDKYEFPGDEIPIVAGSALLALEALIENPKMKRGENKWVDKILMLMDEVDKYIPTPERQTDKPFLLAVEDVLSITGRGTVATGRVERGTLKVGENIELVGLKDTKSTVVTGLEMFKRTLDETMAGDNVGVLLRWIQKKEIERGMVLAKPGSITPHTKFEAQVYVLTKEEGGRHSPFLTGYQPQFFVRTTDVTGRFKTFNHIQLANPSSVADEHSNKMAMPGDQIKANIELLYPVAIEKGMRFAIREGGRTVGAGVVTQIIE